MVRLEEGGCVAARPRRFVQAPVPVIPHKVTGGSVLFALWLTVPAPIAGVAPLQFHSAFWVNLHHTLYAASLPPTKALGSSVEEDAAMKARLAAQAAAPKLFAFRSGFWVNLHHFLYVLGRARIGSPDSRRAAVIKAAADLEGLSGRSEDERAIWDKVVHFYAGEVATKDAVFDADLVATTRKLAQAPDTADVTAIGLDRQVLAATLRLAAPVYRAVWWPRHSRANEARIAQLQALVDQHGAAVVKRLTGLYGTEWPTQPRIIDVAAYANWAGGYSTDGGLIVMASTYEDIAGPLGLEMLLHESSHQWDAGIEHRLAAIAAKQGKPLPSLLSHALIFYTSGELVGEAIPGHVPYAVKAGLWNQRGLGAFKPLLDQYWRPYIRGTGTFEDAAGAIIANLH
jgi:hypothetical protein